MTCILLVVSLSPSTKSPWLLGRDMSHQGHVGRWELCNLGGGWQVPETEKGEESGIKGAKGWQ